MATSFHKRLVRPWSDDKERSSRISKSFDRLQDLSRCVSCCAGEEYYWCLYHRTTLKSWNRICALNPSSSNKHPSILQFGLPTFRNQYMNSSAFSFDDFSYSNAPSTVPEGVLRTHPVSLKDWAFDTVCFRKKTPWTLPETVNFTVTYCRFMSTILIEWNVMRAFWTRGSWALWAGRGRGGGSEIDRDMINSQTCS